jgi:hypothetical protein
MDRRLLKNATFYPLSKKDPIKSKITTRICSWDYNL